MKHDWRLDLIKIIAIIMVLYNHLYSYSFGIWTHDLDILGYFFLLLSVLCKCGPPLFFMVSGAELLGKNESYGRVLKHRVLRFLIVIIIIASLYGIKGKSVETFIKLMLNGMNWYLYAYLAFLLMLPLYRKIAQNITDNECKWYIIIVAAFHIFQGLLYEFGIDFSLISQMNMVVSTWASNTWQIIFPLLGYILYHKRDTINIKILMLGALGSLIISLVCISWDMRVRNAINYEMMHQYFIVLPVCAIFLMIINLKIKYEKITNLFSKIAPLTFGMFLIETHTLMRDKIYSEIFGATITGTHGIYISWLMILIEFLVYGLLVWIIRLIPGMKKIL